MRCTMAKHSTHTPTHTLLNKHRTQQTHTQHKEPIRTRNIPIPIHKPLPPHTHKLPFPTPKALPTPAHKTRVRALPFSTDMHMGTGDRGEGLMAGTMPRMQPRQLRCAIDVVRIYILLFRSFFLVSVPLFFLLFFHFLSCFISFSFESFLRPFSVSFFSLFSFHFDTSLFSSEPSLSLRR